MSRLAPLDRALVLILVPLWLICFALGVKGQIEGRYGFAFLGVSLEDADGYPVLTGKVPGSRPRPAVPIRGRRDTQDLYALPLRATS